MNLPLFAADERARVLQGLRAWARAGWLRHLDAAFAAFVAEAAPGDDPQVLLAAALVSQLEGLGHVCLALGGVEQAPSAARGRGGADALEPAWIELGLQPALAAQLLALARELAPAGQAPAAAWARALRASDAVWCVERGDGADRGQPLVFEQGSLYLRRYRDYERRLAGQWLERARRRDALDATRAAATLRALFGEAGQGAADQTRSGEPGPDWQRVACALALRSGVGVITGGPGTGKTFTAARLLVLLFATAPRPEQLRVALAAPTGKAAARLKQSIDGALRQLGGSLGEHEPALRLASRIGPARTLHALLGARGDTRRLRHHAGNPLDLDVLLVDEASMVHLEMMADLLDALPAHARLVLLGDSDQLASVEAGAVLGELCAHARAGRYRPETVREVLELSEQAIPPELQDARGPLLAQQVTMLRSSRRFGGGIAALAEAVNHGDARGAQAQLREREREDLHWNSSAQARDVSEAVLADAGLRACLEMARGGCGGGREELDAWALRVLQGFDALRVLCALRQGPWGVEAINRQLEQALRARSLLGSGEPWYEARPVMVTRNDPELGLFNGDVGMALRGPGGALRVVFVQAGGVRWISPGRLAHVETAFAMTVHKSQGSEFAHALLVLGDGLGVTRELVYTGVTRARSRLSLFTARESALRQGLERVTRRSSGLPWRLQAPGVDISS